MVETENDLTKSSLIAEELNRLKKKKENELSIIEKKILFENFVELEKFNQKF